MRLLTLDAGARDWLVSITIGLFGVAVALFGLLLVAWAFFRLHRFWRER